MYYKEDSELSFYDNFTTYKIVKGDTLQSVAQKLEIDEWELRTYHNMHCQIPDLIEGNFKTYSKFLILEREKSDLSINEEIVKEPVKVSFGKDYQLPFLPKGICKDYSVEYIFEVGDQTDRLEMGVRVNWLATDEKKYHLFEIHRSVNLFIDENLPNRVIDELGTKTVEVLYPLKIVVDDSGKWIDIYNYDEIVSRWNNKKEEIFDYYEKNAVITQSIMEFTESALLNSDSLFTSLRSDYFLRTFFNGIHVGYTADLTFNEEVSFPLEKKKENIFKVEQKINPYLNEDSFIEVQQKGDYLNLNSETNFNNNMWDGKYAASYSLDSYSYFIDKMNVECSIEYDEPIKIKLIVESLKKEKSKI